MNPVIEKFNIEVAFATPQKQKIYNIMIHDGMSVLDAISISNIKNEFPEYTSLFTNPESHIGVFGKKINVITYKLKANDRIEIYRPLNKTPNQKRLERAKNLENK